MSSDQKNEVHYDTVLLFGPPGAGKGTWGKLLGMIPGFYHLSTGDLFRSLDTESEIGVKAMKYMRRGELVPDDIVIDLWARHMANATLTSKFRPQKDILVLDGFPRTPQQAEMLKKVAVVKAILRLDCDDREILIERMHRRAVLEGRSDDASESLIRRRFEIYDRQSSETISHFPQQLIAHIDVSKPPIQILNSLSSALVPHLS